MHRRYDREQREEVVGLIGTGVSDREIARRTGVPRSTVQNWRKNGPPKDHRRLDPLPPDWRPPDAAGYAYLLGMYLGDGHISRHGNSFGMQIHLDHSYPALIDDVVAVMGALFSTPVGRSLRPGTRCVRLTSYGPHWPRAFPQHGPGPKHKRKIELAAWQREIVDRHPKEFLRGLLHSDGCRSVNRFTVQLRDGPRRYAYARYFFSNRSEDIKDLFCEQCDRLEIKWSRANPRHVSISDRASVALLDEFVGPKS